MSFLVLFFRNLMMGENNELKNRTMIINPSQHVLANYLTPAIQGGFVTPLYPNNSKHPRQKYLLTAKGLTVFNSNKTT